MARRSKADPISSILGIGILVVIVLAVQVVSQVAEFIRNNQTFSIIIGAVFSIIVIAILAASSARQAKLNARIAQVRISDNRSDYIISNNDYRRGTARESFYRKTFLLQLLGLFDNRCAHCGTAENGVDIDHFVFSKNEGGSFAMFHRDGFWVNNAIPLCQTCNRSKLDRSYTQFFEKELLLDIFQRNAEMTKRLNDNPSMAQFRPGQP